MKQVTISQLKNRLSAYLDQVVAGETIIVLDRDQPIARLEPLARGEFTAATLAALERRGAVRRPERRPPIEDLRARLQTGARRIGAVDALLADRAEGR